MKTKLKLTIMVTKFFIALFFCMGGVQIASAQTGNIRGRLIASDGQPAANATITIKDTKKATISNNDGSFVLNKIDTGQHVLVISFVGLKIEEKVLTVTANETTQLNITLVESSKNLDEVIVNARRNPNERTASSAKSTIINFDLPQTVGSVSSTVIRDQQATRVGDIIKN